MCEQYFFDTLNQVIKTLELFPASSGRMIQISDWTKLASSLTNGSYTDLEVRRLFYPVQESDGDDPVRFDAVPSDNVPRQAGFFSSLGKQEYYDLYLCTLECRSAVRFPDIQSLLKIRKDEGEMMTRVMDHVVRWFNPEPVDIIDQQDNNKPLRREDLTIAFRNSMQDAYGSDGWARLREKGYGGADDNAEAWLDQHSRLLERQVLDYVRSHMAGFKDPSTKPYLDQMPEEYETSYTERFAADILWRDLFGVVQNAVAPEIFRPVWRDCVLEREGDDANGRDGVSREDSSTRRPPVSAITRAICGQLDSIPEVAHNPALSGVYASAELSALIDDAVLTWAARRCRMAMEQNESDDGTPLSDGALQSIQLARQGYEKLLSERAVSKSSLYEGQQQQQGPLLPPAPPPPPPPPPPSFLLPPLPQTKVSQSQDGHPSQEMTMSPTRSVNQYQSSQPLPTIRGPDGHSQSSRIDQTREIVRQTGLPSMQQQSGYVTTASSPSSLQSGQQGLGRPEQIARGHISPVPPLAELGRSLELPRTAGGVARVAGLNRGRRTSLPSGRPSIRQPESTKNAGTASRTSVPPPWARGLAATSGNRR